MIDLNDNKNWSDGIEFSIEFWDEFLGTKGMKWRNDYDDRINPDMPIQERLLDYIPKSPDVLILDVGAGPLTFLGKKRNGEILDILPIDPLADEYNRLLEKHGIKPIIKTEKYFVENLSESFFPLTFDFIYARNCIDHSINPEAAILEMISVLKKDCYIILEHKINEGLNNNYEDFHQWNFSLSDGDFIISSQIQKINFSEKYQDICEINCELDKLGGRNYWLITKIKKK